MQTDTIASALALGIVEGMTEFIPVSSTAHILLLGHFIGFESTGKTFEVLIQLGAILAILAVYFGRLLAVVLATPTEPGARRFVGGIVLAFLPAAVLGVLLHGFIKEVLFETPVVICVSLIAGGIALLFIDRLKRPPRYANAFEYPLWLALAIGCCQTLAMVPGVSRSGATIGGALLFGADKRSAAEFSFFLALPTMAGAFTYDLYQNRNALSVDDALIIVIGFVAAFLAALFVVRRLLDFVSRHGFAPFAWWRIAVGTLGLVGLLLTGGNETPAAASADTPALTAPGADPTLAGAAPPQHLPNTSQAEERSSQTVERGQDVSLMFRAAPERS